MKNTQSTYNENGRKKQKTPISIFPSPASVNPLTKDLEVCERVICVWMVAFRDASSVGRTSGSSKIGLTGSVMEVLLLFVTLFLVCGVFVLHTVAWHTILLEPYLFDVQVGECYQETNLVRFLKIINNGLY